MLWLPTHEDLHRAAWVLGGRLALLGRTRRGIGARGTSSGSVRGDWQISDQLGPQAFLKGQRRVQIAGVYFSSKSAPNPGLEGTMKIDGTTFGSITIDGKTYDHDVIVRLSEKVEKRKKKLSKRVYGSSHTISEDEAKFVFEKGCKRLIFGTGQDGNASLSAQAAAYLEKQGCKVIAEPTPDAIHIFNKSKKAKVALFHVTC